MNKLNIFKLVLGCFLLLISFIGITPIIKDSIVLNSLATTHYGALDSRNRAYSTTHVSETNYPILIGCLCLSGTFLIMSVKIEK